MAETKERRKTPRRRSNSAAATPTPDTTPRAEASPEEIRKLIEEAAYYRAKQRGFAPGHELEDWVQAETEVMRRVERST
jgi:hypothetical protein